MPELTTAGAILVGLITVASAIRWGANAIARAGRRALRRRPEASRARTQLGKIEDHAGGDSVEDADTDHRRGG